MKRKITAGLTSVMLPVFIADTSSTTGGGLSGVTHASSGLVIEYRRAGQSAWTSLTPITKTLGTYASPSTSQAGIVADGALAGAYEVDLPDAAFAVGARFVVIRIRGVANMLACLIEIELDAFAYQTATQPVNVIQVAGQTASASGTVTFPNATLASTTNITAATGVTVSTNNDKTGYSLTATTGLGNQTANITGNLSGSVGSVTGNVGGSVGSVTGNVGGSVGSVATGGISSSSFAAGAINAAAIATDAIGSDEIAASAVTKIQNGLATPTNITAGTITTVTNLTNLPNIPNNWLTAAGIAAGALDNKGNWNVGKTGYALTYDIAGAFSTVNGTLATLATAANLAAVAGYLDTEIASILAIANKLDSAMELDGAVWRFTVNALEQAPSGGGGGSTDWTADERTAIRTILGVPSTGTTPEVPSAGALKVIDDLIDNEIGALTTAVDNLPTNAELATALGTADDAVLAAIAALNNVSAAQVVSAMGTGTFLTAIPWNAAWDTEVQSECTDALNAYDAPTKAEMDAAFTEIKGATWSSSTDTLEAIRDRGDAAWVTGSGGSGGGSSTGNGTGSTAALRGTTDLTPIQFTFPTPSITNSGFTTKTKRIDGGSSANITGAISFLYSINGEHYYQIAYNAADRPSAAGVVTYLLSDGTSTVSFDLQVIAIASESGGSSIVPPSQAANSAGQFFINAGVDFSETFTVTIPSGWDKVLFTVKDGREIDESGDADSILQLQVSATPHVTDGVLYLNREAAADRTLGAISVANDRTSVTVTLKAALTTQLRSGKTYNWDIAVIDGSTKPYLTSPGIVNIKDVVTKTLP